MSAEIERLRRFVDTWQPYRGGRALASHHGEHLFLGDLRAALALAEQVDGEAAP